MLSVTPSKLTVLVYKILFSPTSIEHACTHTHRAIHAKSTPKFYVDISTNYKALGLNEMESRITGEM